MATRRAVCLLRSRRRTFLLFINWKQFNDNKCGYSLLDRVEQAPDCFQKSKYFDFLTQTEAETQTQTEKKCTLTDSQVVYYIKTIKE